MGISASILLNVVNIILEGLNQNQIDKIGHNSKSKRDSIVLFTNFVTQFFNTGIILLLCNSNLSYSIISFIPIENSFVDMSYHWYTATGTTIVIVMIICAVSPIIEILIEFLI
jgi:glutamate formiminotransferase